MDLISYTSPLETSTTTKQQTTQKDNLKKEEHTIIKSLVKINKKYITLLRCQRYLAQDAYWGHLQDRMGIWTCWFLRRGENWITRRKTSIGARTRTNNKLYPHIDGGSGSRTRATSVGGECSHHCAIPAPHFTTSYISQQRSSYKNVML